MDTIRETETFKHIKQGGFKKRILSLVTLSLLITFSLFFFLINAQKEVKKSLLVADSEVLSAILQRRIDVYAANITSAAAYIVKNDGPVGQDEWESYVGSLELAKRFPGILSMGVIERVQNTEVDSFEKRNKGVRIFPRKTIEDYYPVVGIYTFFPLNPKKVIGHDFMRNDFRKNVLKHGKNSDEVFLTEPTNLFFKKGTSFIMLRPFYLSNKNLSLKKGKNAKLDGYVYNTFLGEQFANDILPQKDGISVQVFDGEKLLLDEKEVADFDISVDRKFKVYNREWTMVAKAGKSYYKNFSDYTAYVVLFIGLGFNVLLIWLLYNTSRVNLISVALAEKMSRESMEQKNALINASKLASMGEMAGGIAHEIKNPLNVILLYVSALKESKHLDEDIMEGMTLRELSNTIEQSVERINSVAEGLRKFSRDGTRDAFEKITLEEVVKDALRFADERFKITKVSLELQVRSKSLVSCQAVALSQVVINLLNNARHAAQDSEPSWVKLIIEEDEKFEKLVVQNSGAKIAKNVAEKIFTPFFTTKAPGEGTGLGLSLSRTIVEAHGGKLYLDQGQEHTTFVIELPKAI